jgi:branched-chain amino acid transport system ATP-binding protein
MPVLEVEKATKYFGGLAAVTNVSFQVNEGEILGLIGPNGAGKTTLFNLLSGAFTPKPGKIIFQGRNITGLNPYKICRMGMARTFQSVKIFPNLTILDNIMLGSYYGIQHGASTSEALKEAHDLLEFVGLSDLKAVYGKDLTLVNQKRLEVARALATRPDLLLLDELMAGLNATEVSEAMELVKRIQKRKITIIMIEHVMRAIMNICDRIIVLHHGVKIAEGNPQEIANSHTVIEVYLGE